MAKLQWVDSQLDKIIVLRGSLPEEVDDLDFEIQGLEGKKGKIEEDIAELQVEILKRKGNIKDFGAQIRKYEEQLNTVKNNREYEALTKEVEYANLEILTSEKKIKQLEDQIDQKNMLLSDTQAQVDERSNDLREKQKELEVIIKETELEESRLRAESDEASKLVDKRIHDAYGKIRRNMRNGLAIVSTDRDACGGCFAIIPPQTQLEIRQKKKLLFCENCGRMLVDQSFFAEFEEAHTTEAV
ncbi:MAG TPA: C4-type zinc ribbon domain-containing protein [Bacteroidia bacterium]|nr:C4-type zinc ribbon domain-containing protein [Bacteroidia bacterium]